MTMMQALILLSVTAVSMALKAPTVIPNALQRVIMSPLPKVYVYDHCPFCVRVRVAFGLKNIKHEVYFLGNDDIATPTALVGKKVAPIFQMVQDDMVMGESLDIIAKVDTDPKYGPVNIFRPDSGRSDIKKWQKKVKETNSLLQRPRYMMTILPEFQQVDGKNAFVKNHPVPPFEKDMWKKTLTLAEQWGHYENAYKESLGLLNELNESLVELDALVFCTEYCTEGGLSYDDIDLFSRLRSVTIVKGVVWPEKLAAYMNYFSVKGDVPLYDSMAC